MEQSVIKKMTPKIFVAAILMHDPRSVDLQWILKDIRITISYLTILYVYRPIHANGERDAIFRFSRTGSFDPDLSFFNINKG